MRQVLRLASPMEKIAVFAATWRSAGLASDHLVAAAAAAEGALRLAGRLLQRGGALRGGAAGAAASAHSAAEASRCQLFTEAVSRLHKACMHVGVNLTGCMVGCLERQQGPVSEELEAALRALAASASKLGPCMVEQLTPAEAPESYETLGKATAHAIMLLSLAMSRRSGGSSSGVSEPDRWVCGQHAYRRRTCCFNCFTCLSNVS